MAEKKMAEKWVSAELITIEMKISKAGDPAIQLVYKSTDGDWIRDWFGLEKAPDFVWERAAKALCLEETGADHARSVLTDAWTASKHLGKTVLLGVFEEEFNGRKSLKVADLQQEDYVPSDSETKTEAPADDPVAMPAFPKKKVTHDDLPF